MRAPIFPSTFVGDLTEVRLAGGSVIVASDFSGTQQDCNHGSAGMNQSRRADGYAYGR